MGGDYQSTASEDGIFIKGSPVYAQQWPSTPKNDIEIRMQISAVASFA